MTDAHCHVTGGDPSVREFLIGRDFVGVHPWDCLRGLEGLEGLGGLGGLEGLGGLDCLYHLTPALRAVQDNGTAKFQSHAQLTLKHLAHSWRNVLIFQAIQPDLADTGKKVWKVWRFAVWNVWICQFITQPTFLTSQTSQTFPRMHADEVAPDQELADGRIPARHMAMRIRQRSNSHSFQFVKFVDQT